MSGKYHYLAEYIDNESQWPANWFCKFSDAEIEKEEKRLGFNFPDQLKDFWKEIGYGFLKTGTIGDTAKHCINRIMHPTQIADIICLKENSRLILPGVFIVEGAIPFFEISDLDDFLVMLPNSANPGAIYDQWGDYVEKDLETFIHRLYYESPTYYLRINVHTPKT